MTSSSHINRYNNYYDSKSNTWKCDKCPAVFKTWKALKPHIVDKHSY